MALLEVKNVSVRFGGLKALTDFNFALDPGQLLGLIGPNGAGKTTAFNVVSGMYRPTAGSIAFDGREIAGRATFRINQYGIARTFQNIRLFGGLSVVDNVLIGFNQSLSHGFAGTVFRSVRHQRDESTHLNEAMELLKTFRLSARAEELAASLPYGDQRRLEIARALATRPKILLLDEPAAGMNASETRDMTSFIRRLRSELNLTVLLIEHDMRVVMGISDRVTVLDYGTVIAEGT